MKSHPFKFVLLLPLAALAIPLAPAASSVTVPPPASAYVQSIVIDPSEPDILYIASPGAGLYRSNDRAGNWIAIAPPAHTGRIYAVAIDPHATTRVLAGGETSGLWISSDRGNSWESAGLSGISILDIAIDPTNPGHVYVLAPEGVYRTPDITRPDWSLVFDYPSFQLANRQPGWPDDPWRFTRFQKITLNPHNPATVMVGARWEGGFHRSDDGGDSWSHEKISAIFRRVDSVFFDPIDPDIAYAATHHQGLFKTFNGGRSWVPVSRGIEPQRRTPHYGAFLIDGLAFAPGDSKTIYAGSDFSNWKTTDGGRTWRELGVSLTCEFARSFAVSPDDPDMIYAGTNVGIYRSTDGGRTWESANRGLPTREILDTLVVDIANESFEYAVVLGRPALFRRSLTRGGDWISMSWLLYEAATSINFDSLHGDLILQTDTGERRSGDGGFRWDIPAVVYAPRQIFTPDSPPSQARKGEIRSLPVIIHGAAMPDENQVNELYRRPPYVTLQIVKASYPLDQSEPLWSTRWDRSLSGVLGIPRDLIGPADDVLLYVEVRDFQLGTLTGSTRLHLFEGEVIAVQVSPDNSLLD